MGSDDPELLLGFGEAVAAKVEEYNRGWIDQIFARHGELTVALRDGCESAWAYRFADAELRLFVAKCGDSGGRTKTGKPCGKRVAKGKHRCATHPYSAVTVTVDNPVECGRIRPIGGPAGTLVATTDDGWRTTFDSQERYVSAEHVWSEVILEVKSEMELPPEAHLVDVATGTKHPTDPLWPSSLLLRLHPGCAAITVNGRKVEPGYTLGDYGVTPKSKTAVEFG